MISTDMTVDHLNPVSCYLGPKGISTYLTHPYASPLFGDLQDLPPMLIQAGDTEVLRDEVTLLAHKATLAGVNVTHELYEDMVHVFQMFSFLPAADAAIKSVGRWVRQTLPQIEKDSRSLELEDLGNNTGNGMADDDETSTSRLFGSDGEEVRSSVGLTESPTGDPEVIANHGALQLNLEEPDIDTDTLLTPDDGSPTPTGSRSSSPIDHDSPDPSGHTSAPLLRRALTAVAGPTPDSASELRRRRPMAGAASMHTSPLVSKHVSPTMSIHATSNPVSPSPSIRKRLRSPTISMQTHPTTRTRSQSHSDIFHLVEGYVERGAANETVIYSPRGEVRSVGLLLGEEEDVRF